MWKYQDPDPSLKIQMVLEDALIWADSFVFDKHQIRVEDLDETKELKRMLEGHQGQERKLTPAQEAWMKTNRYFSVVWHNEWKESWRKSFLRTRLEAWEKENKEEVLALLSKKEGLTRLDDNLEYHWNHMVAQWAVWTRDWCFTSDPIKYESDRAPLGCEEKNGNAGIGELLLTLMERSYEEADIGRHRQRNSFFLLGIRSRVLPDSPPLNYIERLENYLHGVDEYEGKGREGIGDELVRDILQAIFELARQGFLDRREHVSVLHSLPESLQIECLEFANKRGGDKKPSSIFLEAWKEYKEEIKSMNHLEVIPKSWDEIKPSGW